MKRIAIAVLLLGSASSAWATDIFGKAPVKTAAIGDVIVELGGSDGASVAQVAASNAAAAGNGVFVLGAVYNSSLPTNTSGRSVALQTDINGRLIITQDASAAALLTNLTKVGGTSLALGQTTMSASIPVVLASNSSTIATSVGAPSGAGFNKAAVVNIASAGTSAIVCKSGVTVSQPTKPLQFTISAAAATRCQLRYNDNSSMTNFADVVVTPGAPTVVWTPPSGIVGLTTSATSTTQQYEANCTNFDSVATDVGCAVVYCSSATGC